MDTHTQHGVPGACGRGRSPAQQDSAARQGDQGEECCTRQAMGAVHTNEEGNCCCRGICWFPNYPAPTTADPAHEHQVSDFPWEDIPMASYFTQFPPQVQFPTRFMQEMLVYPCPIYLQTWCYPGHSEVWVAHEISEGIQQEEPPPARSIGHFWP